MSWRIILFIILSLMLVGCSFRKPLTYRTGVGGFVHVQMDLWVSTDHAEPDEAITIRYNVTNNGNDRTIIHLKEKIVMDINVRIIDSKGQVVARWSDGKELTDELRTLALDPGQSKTISMEWKVPKEAKDRAVVIDMTLRYGDDPIDSENGGVTLLVGSVLPD